MCLEKGYPQLDDVGPLCACAGRMDSSFLMRGFFLMYSRMRVRSDGEAGTAKGMLPKRGKKAPSGTKAGRG